MSDKLEVIVTGTERFEVIVPGPPGPNFVINATPEEMAAAPDGTVFLTTGN